MFDATELVAIWNAASKLDPIASAFVKVIVLLAPRKRALAHMRWTDLDNPDDPKLWTTPHAFVKAKKTSKARVYLTPLPALSVRVLKSIPRRHDELVFPSNVKDVPIYPGSTLQRRLVKFGAPSDVAFHAFRHTLASHFTNASDFEVGLVLNHSASNVTAGYRHSYALDLKLKMLSEWSAHVEGLLSQGENVARLV